MQPNEHNFEITSAASRRYSWPETVSDRVQQLNHGAVKGADRATQRGESEQARNAKPRASVYRGGWDGEDERVG
jgi:hypothetical protein